MASNSKSGTSPHEREQFLRERGFSPVRAGKGSHAQWEHTGLKMLAVKHPVEVPANLLSNVAQKFWETTLPDNPAFGTWRHIAKHAEWCAAKTAELKAPGQTLQNRAETARQFRENMTEICAWKKAVRHWLKTGFDAAAAPRAPASYRRMFAPKPVLK